MTMMRTEFAPGRGFTALTIILLAVLVSLGTWQARKVGPKADLIARIEAGLAAPSTDLPSMTDNPANYEYRKVHFEGRLLAAESVPVFGTNLEGEGGYHHYGAVETKFGPVVFVNFGWAKADTVSLPVAVGDDRLFTGVLKLKATPGDFTPANDIAKRTFYFADMDDISLAFGLSSKEYYPFRVMLDPIAEGGGEPQGGQVMIDIPNNHLEYMLTWYGIAGALMAVYLMYGFSKGRKNT